MFSKKWFCDLDFSLLFSTWECLIFYHYTEINLKVDELINNWVLTGFEENYEIVEWLKEILLAFDKEQKLYFLLFVTGNPYTILSSRLESSSCRRLQTLSNYHS
jgi:hypothetical protein